MTLQMICSSLLQVDINFSSCMMVYLCKLQGIHIEHSLEWHPFWEFAYRCGNMHIPRLH